MKYIVSVCLMAILLTGCNSKGNNPQDSMDSSPMMTGFPASSNNTDVEMRSLDEASGWVDYYGSYEGTLPSGSGDGIETTLTLYDDNTYRLKSVYTGKGDDNTFEEHGKYTVAGDIITLQTDNQNQYYKIGGDYILKLDNERQEIKGNLADQYKLSKK